jgi:hypothetical protein
MPRVSYVPKDSIVERKDFGSTDMANAVVPQNLSGNNFYEREGIVSIEAAHFSRTFSAQKSFIKVLPDLGRTGDAVTVFPVTAATPSTLYASPKLEYDIYVYDTGQVKLQAYFSPTLNFHNDEGLKYAVAIDNELPQVIFINKEDNNVGIWNNWVANNIIIKKSEHYISSKGKHILKCWLVCPGVVLQKVVVDFGGVKLSYLGPLETKGK